jgi:hypothetical protein
MGWDGMRRGSGFEGERESGSIWVVNWSLCVCLCVSVPGFVRRPWKPTKKGELTQTHPITPKNTALQEELCSTLAMLHSFAPTHKFAFSRKAVEEAFGQKLEEVFDAFDPEPVASGSIAQVRACVRA